MFLFQNFFNTNQHEKILNLKCLPIKENDQMEYGTDQIISLLKKSTCDISVHCYHV